MRKVKKEECGITYSREKREIVVDGTMRLFGAEHYAEILDVFQQAIDDELPYIVLDIRNLRFLNSSGINVFFKFLIGLKKKNITQLTVRGTNEYFWQKKTLLNFQKMLPNTKLEI